MTREDRLRAAIRTVPDFPKPGIQFRDITTLLADQAAFAEAVDALAELAQPLGAQAVAGIEARGFIFGAALALRLNVGFIPVRKAGKLPVDTISQSYALEYGEATLELDPTAIAAGQKVLLVDDLLATGGTASAAASLLREAGGVCTDAVFVVDLPDLSGGAALREAGIKAHCVLAFMGH